MCCDSGGSSPQAAKPSSSTVTQTNLPGYVEPYFKDLLDRTESEVTKDYQVYPGQRIEGFGDETEAGFQQLRDTATPGDPTQFTEAGTAFSGVAGAGDVATQGQFAGPASFTDAGVAQQYMDPYISNVLNVQQQRLGQRFDEDQVRRNAAAVGAGAFGGSRPAVQDAIAQRELDLQRNEMDARGYSQAYQSGADIFGQERQAELANRRLNTDVFAGNINRAQQQDVNRVSAGRDLQGLGIASQGMAEQKARTLAGIGGAYDDQRQSEMDMAYTDFMNQRDFDRNKLNFYSGIMRGVPVSPSQESTTYNAPPSAASQMLGLGLGGLGLAKAMGRQGGLVQHGGFTRRAA